MGVDRITELDHVIASYDSDYLRPAGANIRSFLIECLAGPLVGMDPKHVHVFCDMYEHARHSYKKFGQLEFNNYINILSELKNLVLQNTQNKPDPSKKSGTPNHNKPVNRPRKRIGSTQNPNSSGGATVVIHRNSSKVLLSQEHGVNNSTAV